MRLDTIRATKSGRSIEDIRADTCKTIPPGRHSEPAEFARLAAVLGSSTDTCLTGRTILVDGGMVRAN